MNHFDAGWALLALLAVSLAPSTPAVSATCSRSKLDLPVTIYGSSAIIGVKFNGEDVRLVLDSGAFWSLISTATADEYHLRLSSPPSGLHVTGVGGEAQMQIATVKEFTLAGATIKNVAFLAGGSDVQRGAAGVLGQNFLQSWNIEYDLANGMVRFFKDKDCGKANLAYWARAGTSLSMLDILEITTLNPHTIGYAFVNGVKIRVLFDTGASRSVLSTTAAMRAGIRLDGPGVTSAGYGNGIGRKVVEEFIVPVASFKIGDDEEIRQTRMRVADIDLRDADMLIGMDFFLSHRMFVGNSQHRAYLTYNGGPVFNLTAATPATPATPVPQASDRESLDAAALARRGTAFAARREFAPALADLSRAVELEPNNPEFLFQRGHAYYEKGDFKAALTDMNQVLALRADHVPALVIRAFLSEESDRAVSLADLEAVDRIAAKSADVRLELAGIYGGLNLPERSIMQLNLWIDAHGQDSRLAEALNSRCWKRAQLGQELALALKDCDRALGLIPKASSAQLRDSRGLVRLRLGDYEGAIKDYDAALVLQPKQAASLYGRGIAKLRKNERAAGEADIALAIQASPTIAKDFSSFGVAP